MSDRGKKVITEDQYNDERHFVRRIACVRCGTYFTQHVGTGGKIKHAI